MSGHVNATFYVQIEAVRSEYTRDRETGEYEVQGAKAVRITKSRPAQPVPGSVLVKLTVRMPKSAFDPLRPEAVVIVPESMTEATPLEVIAEDPHAPGGEA